MSSTNDEYSWRLLRVDLSREKISEEEIEESTLKNYLGGAGLGIKILYDEVPPNTAWSDPKNRLILASGPLGGTVIGGSGTFCVTTKGPLTNGVASVQANGYFGAFLRFCGYLGVVIQGASKDPLYLYIKDGEAELRDASKLSGKGTYETEDAIRNELKKRERQLSVVSIGPAGENLVKFAGIFSDKGHSASHNGLGAVMGSKKLKAIAVERGKRRVLVKDKQSLREVANEFLEIAKKKSFFKWGTLAVILIANEQGWLPIKNYTTNIWHIDEKKLSRFDAEAIRKRYSPKPHSCWACQQQHCGLIEIKEGPYAGLVVEEPEYEQFAAWAPLIGQDEVDGVIVLSYETDNLGLENNEAGWIISWLMECYEKGILTKEDLDGVEMRWGDVEAVRAMLRKIAHREGIGDLLAEGIRIAANKIGGKALECAIFTHKGNTPRGHDHRTRWHELFDTCVSDTGTIETHLITLGMMQFVQGGDPIEISTQTAKTRWVMPFEDSLGTCRFNTGMNGELLSKAVAAVTGWDFTVQDAKIIGFRIANLMRAFNIRHGHTPDMENPSLRYGSTPKDGPLKGKSILSHWDEMIDNYYKLMGWDRKTGKPLPETLERFGLKDVVKDLW